MIHYWQNETNELFHKINSQHNLRFKTREQKISVSSVIEAHRSGFSNQQHHC